MTVGELQDEDDGNEQVCLMLLTAIKHDDDGQTRERIPFYIKHYNDGQTCERIPFYAAIDTGATKLLCSHDLAQTLVIGILTDINNTECSMAS